MTIAEVQAHGLPQVATGETVQRMTPAPELSMSTTADMKFLEQQLIAAEKWVSQFRDLFDAEHESLVGGLGTIQEGMISTL
jgi:hypothetical protein